MSTAKPGGGVPGDRPFSEKPGDKTRDKIRNVLGKASVSTGLGKLPPQAIDLEEAVLGALMLEKDALTSVIEILQVDSFYKESHQKVYEAILQLFDNSEPVDILTVTNQLRNNGTLDFAGGAFYISGLTHRVNSAANVEYHARIVSEKAIKRHLITIASEIEREAYEDTTDTFALLDKVEQDIFNVSEVNIRKNYADMRSMMREAFSELEAKKQHKDGLTGVPTGFTNLDRITSGWQKSDLVIIAARPAMGKCLGKGTQVLMYDGTLKKVEDVVVGDQLMGDDSTPRRVLSLARGRERMYWVRQNRGMDYRVNESHILSLKRSRTEGPHQNGDVLNISVRDYLTRAPKFKSNYKGYKVAVEFEEKTLSVDPYFLGLWLGDGDRNSPRITTNDAEVVEYLEEYAVCLSQTGKLATVSTYNYRDRCNQSGGEPHAITKGYRGGQYDFSIKDELRQLNLLGDKHIPQDYLVSSTQQRLLLLAGLIDSDGHYLTQSNGYEITQKNKRLAHQIKFLCDSLGFRTSIRKKTATGRQSVISAIGYESEVYRVRFYGDTSRIPVRLSRKKSLPWKNRINWQATGISVVYDKVDDYYGFEIDGNHLFLLEDMTVTHNTAFVLSALRNAAVDFGHNVAIFSLEMSSIQLVNRLISAEAELESEKIKKGSLREDEWQQLYAKTNRLTEASIFIDDTPALSIRELRSKCRRLKAQNDIELIVIDYLQLMTGDASRTGGGNREQEIASISRALKNIAKELSVPVIALSQLSRAVETRGGDKRPQLSDLRESGCLTGDALVFNAKTGEQVPIAELVRRQNAGQLNNFSTLATNPQWKLSECKVSNAFYSGKKEVFELVTRSGRTIKASGNHPFLKLQGWAPLDELKVGDKIAVPRQLSVSTPANPMSEDEVTLLAHLLGDGCILPKQPYHYTSADPANIKIVQETAKRLFSIEGKTVQQENWWHYYLRCPYHLTHGKKHPITHWYDSLGLSRVRSYEKKIPEAVFQCDEKRIALFLHHLWATDGNISSSQSNRNQKDLISIYYASSSQQLVQQVQHLLLRLGILSTVRVHTPKKHHPMYYVQVYGREEQLKFLRQVGCYGQRGECVLSLIEKLEAVEANPNFDVIPKEAWEEWIKQYKTLSEISWRAFARKMNMQYCGHALFKNGISRTRMQRIYQILPFATLKHLAESDVLWDEIVSLRSLGVQDVYDITVDEAHNFVANDIITHNSIEQDADMVMFLYRPEYYGLTEDSEGQPVQGIGEIIISKHRNGALDTVQLKFIGKFTKFTNLNDMALSNSYGSTLQSASMDDTFNDPGIVTFASKANDRQYKPDDDEANGEDDSFSGEDAPF